MYPVYEHVIKWESIAWYKGFMEQFPNQSVTIVIIKACMANSPTNNQAMCRRGHRTHDLLRERQMHKPLATSSHEYNAV